jgi:hypothetical protein
MFLRLPSTFFGCVFQPEYYWQFLFVHPCYKLCWTESSWFVACVSVTFRKVTRSHLDTALLYHDFVDDPINLGRLVHGTFSASKKKVYKCGAASRQKLSLEALQYESCVVNHYITPLRFQSRNFTWKGAWRIQYINTFQSRYFVTVQLH